jgi:hypothetical protein
VDYRVEWGADPSVLGAMKSLQNKVRENFRDKWRPIGGIALVNEPRLGEPTQGIWVAAQALVRDVPDPRQGSPEPR